MFDALMLAAIVAELHEQILDGKVQRVLLLDPLSIGLEIYANGRRHQLLLNASTNDARVHLVGVANPAARLTGDADHVTPLLLLLRKWVRGARLVKIAQESPLERVVHLRFAKFIPYDVVSAADETDDEDNDNDEVIDGDVVETTLILEVMGHHSNLILVNGDGLIMDSAKRVPSRLSRVRQVLPRLPYAPVPPQEKADPRRTAAVDLAALLAAQPAQQLAPLLVNSYRGLSPQTAREVTYRATGAVKLTAATAAPQVAAIARALDELLAPLRTGAWTPALYSKPADDTGVDDAATVPVAFSPFLLTYLHDLTERRFVSPSALVEHFFGTTQQVQAHGQRKGTLSAQIAEEQQRLLARQRALLAESERATAAERWRRWGETIYAYSWSLQPGQTELVADDQTVPLDPGKTPSENAQEYFERYRKAQSAAAHLPELLTTTGHDLAYLAQLQTLLTLAAGFDQIAALNREWQHWQQSRQQPAGGQAQRQKPRGSQQPGKPQTLRTRAGHQIFIGHTSNQNDAVTFTIAGPDDSWFHSRGVPGSHVIVKWAGGQQDAAVIQAAAELAAYYSGNRTASHVEVDHAARRDVRKIRGAGPGMVTYRNEETVRVAPKNEADLRQRGVIE